MVERTITHKGHSIVIHDGPNEIAVTIDGHRVRVFGSDAGYWTPSQAYRRFGSLDDLARGRRRDHQATGVGRRPWH